MLKKLKKILHSKTKELFSGEETEEFLTKSLEKNLKILKEKLEPADDISYRHFNINTEIPTKACLIYLKNMIDKKNLEEYVLSPLMDMNLPLIPKEEDFLKSLQERVIGVTALSQVGSFESGLETILDGNALFLLEGYNQGLDLKIKKLEKRSIEESTTEPVVQGPRDGFVETLGVNLTLLRRRLKTPKLKIENYQLGALTKTDIAVVYLEGVAKKDLVEEVKRRLLSIDLDGILESNYLVEYMEDSPWSPFPQTDSTDRPDSIAAGILDGQVAVLVDNTPFALLMPVVFPQFLYAAEDYYTRYLYASFTRLIRFLAINIALLLPSFYIAVVTFHQELLPTEFLISIVAGREQVPFPAFLEALMMETTFEILREAGVRLPRPVGQATSIVGALVIGNAAVDAGLVSPVMVIVVAVTALASFIIPSPTGSFAIRLLRFPIMFLAAALGLYGVMFSMMAILVHLCSLRSFGVPYLSPLAPVMTEDLKNTFVRTPWWMMINRPMFYDLKNAGRQPRGQKPKKPPTLGGRKNER